LVVFAASVLRTYVSLLARVAQLNKLFPNMVKEFMSLSTNLLSAAMKGDKPGGLSSKVTRTVHALVC
jgi:hypothetical protein